MVATPTQLCFCRHIAVVMISFLESSQTIAFRHSAVLGRLTVGKRRRMGDGPSKANRGRLFSSLPGDSIGQPESSLGWLGRESGWGRLFDAAADATPAIAHPDIRRILPSIRLHN